jgi:hypothetical protein
MMVEKVEEYMIGEDLIGAQDKESLESIKSKNKNENENEERDKESLSLEETEQKAREKDGSLLGLAMFKNVKGSREIWGVIRKHLEEASHEDSGALKINKGKCNHSLKEIFLDIPMVQEENKQLEI